MTTIATAPSPYAPPAAPSRAQGLVALYLAITALVLALLMVFGLLMRASQAGVITLPPALFYQLLTAHGIGMVAISGLGGAGVMWYFLSRYVSLTPGILVANLVFFLVGVVLVLGAIFIAYAVRIYVDYSDALARRTFRYSIVYLAALFAALLVDHYL